MSAINQHQAGRLAAGIQANAGIGKVSGQPINNNIGKITPMSRDSKLNPIPQSTNNRENYVRQD